MKKLIVILIVLFSQFCAVGGSDAAEHANAGTRTVMKEGAQMKITIADKEYQAALLESATQKDILKMLPLDLTLTRFAGHEFYSALPAKPAMAKETTSFVLAGHLYYWDGWNAFVINYEDCDISPYNVVHLGEIQDKFVNEYLKKADKSITVRIEVK